MGEAAMLARDSRAVGNGKKSRRDFSSDTRPLREAAEISSKLLEVARSLAAQTDLEHVLSTLADLTPRLVKCKRTVIWRYEEARKAVLPWHASGLDESQIASFYSVMFELDDMDLLGQLLQDGRSLVVEASGLPDWMVTFFDMRLVLLVPLICKGRPLGFIVVDSPGRSHRFTERETTLIEGIASHAALAIENARLYKQAVWRADQLAALYEAGRSLSASLAIGDLLAIVAESAARLVGAEWCTVSFTDQDGGSLVPMYRWPQGGEPPPTLALAGLDVAHKAACEGQSVILEHGRPIPVRERDSAPFGSAASVPMLSKGEVIGVLDIFSRRAGAFGAEEVRLLEAFAAQACTAMENGRLFQQLADGKRAWEQTFDAIADGICVRDQNCRILRANQALAGMVDRSINAISGTRLCDLLPELHESCNVCHNADVWDDDRLREPTNLRLPGPEPGLLALRDYPIRVSDEGVIRWVTVIKDITVERRMQDALIRSEKMRALGEMATGVAHDFNNLLAAILGRAELSLLEETRPDNRRALEAICRAALDGVETVRRIQEYSRVRHDVAQRKVEVNEVVETAVDLARPKWKVGPERAGQRIDMVLDLQPLPNVLGTPSDLREVLMNLIFNAVDAMPDGGRITIGTRLVGDRVVISVADTGCGMTEDIQRRIFDPFFTSKGEGGNGLGLSVSYGIVSRYGGDIVVQSTPNAGSEFVVRLPVAPETPQGFRSSNGAASEPAAPARVLLVDDDVEVLDSVAQLLMREGHQVTALNSPRAAVETFAGEKFDYVITDLGMPELNGWELAEQLRALDGDTPIILLTGWHAKLTNAEAERRGISAVLPKPCTLADLRRALIHIERARGSDPPAKAQSEPRPPDALRVLVVDDQVLFADMLAERLRLDGHHVITAATGREAVELGREDRFDLVLVDMRLPDLSGTDVAIRLRAVPVPPYIVLMTGLATEPGDARLGRGVDYVLPKPCKGEELLDVLNKARQRAQGY